MQFVRNEDQRQALPRHFLQRCEQAFRFLRRQNGGRFVEDQHIGVVIERFQNFHALLFTDRKIAKPHIRIDLEAETLGNLRDLGACCAMRGFELPQAFGAGDDVFQNREVGCKREMLVHHANARINGRTRLALRDFNVFHEDASFIRHIMAEQDVHQRGFARTILTQKRENFAALKLQRNIVIGGQCTKALGDVLQFKNCCRRHWFNPATGNLCRQRPSSSSR